MTPEQRGLLILFLSGALLLGLGLVDVVARRSGEPRSPRRRRPWTLSALLGLALACTLGRIPATLGREARNADAHWYAATASFAAASGESLFDTPAALRGIVFLHALGAGFALVDVVTCVVAGAGGLLLGLACLRADRPLAALLCPPLYLLGSLPHEGLASNCEPYAALFLCAWLYVRLGGGLGREVWRRLAAGACLGAAALMKEQAIPFLLLEPLTALLERRRRGPELPLLALARDMGLAALGYWIPLGIFAACLAWHGNLGSYVANLFSWAGGGGPFGLAAPGPPETSWGDALREALAANFAVYLNPVGLLGLAGALRTGLEASQLGQADRELPALLTLLALLGLGAAAIGAHWLPHYFLLALPGLAALAALRLSDLPGELRRRGPAQISSAVLLSLLVLLSVRMVHALWVAPRLATGASLTGAGLSLVEEVGDAAAAHTRPDQPLLVWGWRPELYSAAGRPPATRWRGDWLLRVPPATLLADLDRRPPGAVVVPGSSGILAGEGDPYRLQLHPELTRWLATHGYHDVPVPGGYRLLVPR